MSNSKKELAIFFCVPFITLALIYLMIAIPDMMDPDHARAVRLAPERFKTPEQAAFVERQLQKENDELTRWRRAHNLE